MYDMVTVRGVVGVEPHDVGSGGVRVLKFRLASNQSRYNASTRQWEDVGTNWFNVAAFRALASNVAASVHKGDRVIVTGRLRITTWTNGEKSGTSADIDADTIGPDLCWCTALVTRTPRGTVQGAPSQAASGQAASGVAASGLGGAPQAGAGRREVAHIGSAQGAGFDPDESTAVEAGADGWARSTAQ